jgi:predicted nucleotide-binding protein
MTYYHIQIVAKGNTLEEKDKDEGVARVISERYHAGRDFLFDGRWISPSDVSKIRIFATASTSDEYEYTNDIDEVFDMHKNDVTRLWIHDRPQKAQGSKSRRHQGVLGKNVFIVHGRDHEPMQKLKAMLYEFGLNPIVLHEQPSGSRTIVEKLEKYSDVGYAFIILTPDDIGGTYEGKAPVLGAPMLEDSHFRARQNVILEFGYFMGLLNRDRVCCLLKGNVERPSDMHGIVYIPFKDSIEEIRLKIMKELKEAGYEVKI